MVTFDGRCEPDWSRRPSDPPGTVTVYVWNGTNEAVGSKVSVVAEVSAHDPPMLGEIVGIGLPGASGCVRCTVIGPAGETPVAPDFGDDQATASAFVWVVPVLCDPPVVVPLVLAAALVFECRCRTASATPPTAIRTTTAITAAVSARVGADLAR